MNVCCARRDEPMFKLSALRVLELKRLERNSSGMNIRLDNCCTLTPRTSNPLRVGQLPNEMYLLAVP